MKAALHIVSLFGVSFAILSIGISESADLHWELNSYEGNKTYSNGTSINKNIGYMLPGSIIQIDWESEHYSSYFNGDNSGILIDDLSGSCLATDLSQCTDGFSVAFWIRWIEWKSNFIISSTWFNWKQFTEDTIPIEVWNGTTAWRMFFGRNVENKAWEHYVITWSQIAGISVFVDGLDKSSANLEATTAMHTSGKDIQPGRLALGTSAEKIRSKEETPIITMRRFSLWNTRLTKDQVKNIYNSEVSPKKQTQPVPMEEACVSISSSIEHFQKSLVEHTFSTMILNSAVQCYQECVKYRQNCTSYNYGHVNGISYCELNNKRKSDVGQNFFVPRDDFRYFEII